MKNVSLKILQKSQENTCARVSVPEACNFIKNETLALVFSCEFCEISKNIFFTEHLWATASGTTKGKMMIRGERRSQHKTENTI